MSADFSGFDQIKITSPRIYHTSLGVRVLCYVFGAVLVLGGLACIWYFGSTASSRPAGGTFFLQLFFLFGVLLGIYILAATAKAKVVLYADAIELHGAMSVKRLEQRKIDGIRRIKTRGGPIVQLIPSDSSLKQIKISSQWKTDSTFLAWLSGLPDLDAKDIQSEMEEVAADPLLGSTPEERLRRNENAQKIAKYFQGAAIVIGIWAYVYPRPYQFLICLIAVLPLLAIALMFISKGVYRVHQNKANVRPGLAAVFVAPAIALLARVHMDFHLLNWKAPLPLALAGIVAFGCLMFLADQTIRSNQKMLLLYSLTMAAYGYGAGSLANAMLDKSEAQMFSPTVIGKHMVSGKSRTYYLRLSPWGPYVSSEEVTVASSLYHQVRQGQPVCISLWRGALHMPWYVVGICENDVPLAQ